MMYRFIEYVMVIITCGLAFNGLLFMPLLVKYIKGELKK